MVVEFKFKLKKTIGFDSRIRRNVISIGNDCILFTAGNVLNLLNCQTKKTTHFQPAARQNISAIVKHPSQNKIAIAIHDAVEVSVLILEISKFVEAEFDGSFVDLDTTSKLILPHSQCKIVAMAFDPHQNRLATVGSDPDYLITIWDLQTSLPSLRSKAFSQDTYSIEFHPQLANLLVTSGVGHLKYWQIANTFTGLKLQGNIGKFAMAELCDITSAAYLDEFRVLTGTNSGHFLLWESGIVRMQIYQKGKNTCHSGPVDFIRLEGRNIISAGHDGYIRIWDRAPLDSIGDSDPFTLEIEAKEEFMVRENLKIRHIDRMLNNSNIFYIQDCEGAILKYDSKDKAAVEIISFPAGPFLGFDLAKNTSLYAYSNVEGLVQICDINGNRSIDAIKSSIPITCLKILETVNQQMYLLTGDQTGHLKFYKYGVSTSNAIKFNLVFSARPHSSAVSFMKTDNLMKFLMSISENQLFIFNMDSKSPESLFFKPIGFYLSERKIKDAFFISGNPLKMEFRLLVIQADGRSFIVHISNGDTNKGSFELVNYKSDLIEIEKIHGIQNFGSSNSFLASHNPYDKLALSVFQIDDSNNITSRKLSDFPISTKVIINQETSSLLVMDEDGNIWRYPVVSPGKSELFALNVDSAKKDLIKASCQLPKRSNFFGICNDGQTFALASADGSIAFAELSSLDSTDLMGSFDYPAAKVDEYLSESAESDNLTLEEIKLAEYRKLESGEYQAAREKLKQEAVDLRQSLSSSLSEDILTAIEFDHGLKKHYEELLQKEKDEFLEKTRKDREKSEHIHKRIVTYYIDPFVEREQIINGLGVGSLAVESYNIYRTEVQREETDFNTKNSEYLVGHLNNLLSLSNKKIQEMEKGLYERSALRKMNLDQREELLNILMKMQPGKHWEDERKAKLVSYIGKQLSGHNWKTDPDGAAYLTDPKIKSHNIDISFYSLRNQKSAFNSKFQRLKTRKNETVRFIKNIVLKLKQLMPTIQTCLNQEASDVDFESIITLDDKLDLSDFNFKSDFSLLFSDISSIVDKSLRRKASEWNECVQFVITAQQKFDRLVAELAQDKINIDCEINVALLHISENSQDLAIMRNFETQTLEMKADLEKLKEERADIQEKIHECSLKVEKINLELQGVEAKWDKICEKFRLGLSKDFNVELLGDIISLGKEVSIEQVANIPGINEFLAIRFQYKNSVKILRENIQAIETEAERLKIDNGRLSQAIIRLEDQIKPQDTLKLKAILESPRWIPLRPSQITNSVDITKPIKDQEKITLFDQRDLLHIDDMITLAGKTIGTLKKETTQFKQQLTPISDELESRRAVLHGKQDDLIDLQISKFGKPITLRELETLRKNDKIHQRRDEIKMAGKEKYEEAAKIGLEYNSVHDGLKQVLEENTLLMNIKHDLLEQIVNLQEKTWRLESQNKRLSNSFEYDEKADIHQLELKLENYEMLIESTRQEILRLGAKNPESYPINEFEHPNNILRPPRWPLQSDTGDEQSNIAVIGSTPPKLAESEAPSPPPKKPRSGGAPPETRPKSNSKKTNQEPIASEEIKPELEKPLDAKIDTIEKEPSESKPTEQALKIETQ